MKKLFMIFFLLVFIFPFSAISEENSDETGGDLDALFEAPADDIVVEEEQLENVDHTEVFEKSDKLKIKGNFSSTGVLAAGWQRWDFFSDPTESFDFSAGIKAKASLSLDARPTKNFYVYGKINAVFDPLEEDTKLWSGINLESLYCDYILNDFLYTRIGQHSFSWGQGRLYTPGNLMSDSGKSFNIRMNIPTLSGLSLVILTNGARNVWDIVYAGKADFVFGSTMLSPALRWQYDEGIKALLSFKQVLFGIDFFADITADFNYSFNNGNILAGFFKEWKDIILYAEYLGTLDSDLDYVNKAGIALGFDNPFGLPFDFGIKAKHNFMDNSGTLTLGIKQKLWSMVTMNIGLPIVYGSDNSSAVQNNEDPSGRIMALVFALELNGNF